MKDFIPIAPLTRQPYVLVAGKRAGIAIVRELIAAAKAKPNELKFASWPGSGTHLGIVKFNLEKPHKKVVYLLQSQLMRSRINIAGTIAGRTAYMLAPISLALPEIRDGKLLALGVTTARRSTLLPEVPTIAEAGVSRIVDFPIWYGVWAPAGSSGRSG